MKPLSELLQKYQISLEHLPLFTESLTHSSAPHSALYPCYERLEFFGDSILNFLVSEWLFHRENTSQGQMTTMRSNFVRENSLYQVGLAWELDQYLIVGESVQVLQKRQIADVVEAFLAAYYLTYGFTRTKTFCEQHLFPHFTNPTPILSYKTCLQELVQARGEKVVYALIHESGPSHAKLFTVQLAINKKVMSEGSGKRIALAEEEAAKHAYQEYIK